MNEPANTTAQVIEQPEPPINGNDTCVLPHQLEARSNTAISPQAGCATWQVGGMTVKPSTYLCHRRVEARFPNLAAEKNLHRRRDVPIRQERLISRPSMLCCQA